MEPGCRGQILNIIIKKSGLKKEIGSRFLHLDFERPSDFAKLSTDLELFLKEINTPLIIDEAQQIPEIFPILRAEVDDRKKNRQFIVPRSSHFKKDCAYY